MERTPVIPNVPMDNDKRHSLGQRAFFFFFVKHLKKIILMLLVIAAAWYVERWIPDSILPWWQYGLIFLILITAGLIVFLLFHTWLDYRYYTYTFTEEAFIMTHGVMVRNETAALYHQIQNVSIQRGAAERLIGVSRILIFLDGDETGHAKIILPAVSRKKAKLVQKELLVRARQSMSR